MFGFMLDSLFMDQLNADLERISRYNESTDVRRIEFAGDDAVAGCERDRAASRARAAARACARCCAPWARTDPPSTLLLSYLLFERGFTREMIDLGLRGRVRARVPRSAHSWRCEGARQFRTKRG